MGENVNRKRNLNCKWKQGEVINAEFINGTRAIDRHSLTYFVFAVFIIVFKNLKT